MTDCAHWLPIIAEQAQSELRDEQAINRRKNAYLKTRIDDIRAAINCMENEVTDNRQENHLYELQRQMTHPHLRLQADSQQCVGFYQQNPPRYDPCFFGNLLNQLF